ncbi:MAG: response regulator [Bacteroidales bacterium]|nr:response regulator [Bacteroidales bacterium]
MGLTITKHLVQLINGKIKLESEEGKGTSFSIDVEFEIAKEEILKEVEQDVEENLKGYAILVVEDNLVNQKVIGQILKNWQANYCISNHGGQALDLLKDNDYDLILMDLQMPVLDGFETRKKIRNNKNYQHVKNIPIIALTADAFVETKNKVFKNQMNDYVSKPFNRLELNTKIKRLVK